MAALFDTTVLVLLLRGHASAESEALLRAARAEIEAGGAILPAVATSELLVGETTGDGQRRLSELLSRIPTLVLTPDSARDAGAMGALLAREGATVPLPDLLIAATAVWLDLPILTWDGDFARARRVAEACGAPHPGAELLRRLRLHPASRGAGS